MSIVPEVNRLNEKINVTAPKGWSFIIDIRESTGRDRGIRKSPELACPQTEPGHVRRREKEKEEPEAKE